MARKRRAGRPNITPGIYLSRQISVKLSPGTSRSLKAIARQKKMKVSAVVREMVEKRVNGKRTEK